MQGLALHPPPYTSVRLLMIDWSGGGVSSGVSCFRPGCLPAWVPHPARSTLRQTAMTSFNGPVPVRFWQGFPGPLRARRHCTGATSRYQVPPRAPRLHRWGRGLEITRA